MSLKYLAASVILNLASAASQTQFVYVNVGAGACVGEHYGPVRRIFTRGDPGPTLLGCQEACDWLGARCQAVQYRSSDGECSIHGSGLTSDDHDALKAQFPTYNLNEFRDADSDFVPVEGNGDLNGYGYCYLATPSRESTTAPTVSPTASPTTSPTTSPTDAFRPEYHAVRDQGMNCASFDEDDLTVEECEHGAPAMFRHLTGEDINAAYKEDADWWKGQTSQNNLPEGCVITVDHDKQERRGQTKWNTYPNVGIKRNIKGRVLVCATREPGCGQ